MSQQEKGKLRLMVLDVGACALVALASQGFAADDKMMMEKPAAGMGMEKAMSPEEKAMMEKMTAFMTPAENHKVLDAIVGNWDFVIKSWMSADAKPEESTGTAEIVWTLDGHFTKETVKSTMMGKPFEGMGFIGYDNLKKEYESVWIDSMSTSIMKSSGQYDTAAKTLSSKGTFTCPMVGGDRASREVMTMVDADHFNYEMHSPGMDGKEFKMMEIKYTRKK